MGVGVEQSKLVVGGVVVQVQGCSAGDSMMVYLAGSVPHSHQPGPWAIAAQVLSESAAWQHPALVMEAGIRGKVRLDVCVAPNSLAISFYFHPRNHEFFYSTLEKFIKAVIPVLSCTIMSLKAPD